MTLHCLDTCTWILPRWNGSTTLLSLPLVPTLPSTRISPVNKLYSRLMLFLLYHHLLIILAAHILLILFKFNFYCVPMQLCWYCITLRASHPPWTRVVSIHSLAPPNSHSQPTTTCTPAMLCLRPSCLWVIVQEQRDTIACRSR